jgi:predicted MFS family arabinose efflux permease
MLADLAPPGRAGEALSFNSLALYLGIAFGPTVAELLLDGGGFTVAWLGGAALAATASLIAVTLRETAPPRAADAPTGALIHRGAIGPSAALFTGVAGMAGLFAFVTLHARDIGMDGSRGVLLLFGIVVVACRVVFARLPDRLPPFALGAAALGLVASGLLLIGAVGTPAGLHAGAALTAVGVAFITPAFFGAIISRVDPSERGAAFGTASIFLDLAFSGGPVLAGIVAAAAGIPAGFAAAAALAAIGAAGSLVAATVRRPAAT